MGSMLQGESPDEVVDAARMVPDVEKGVEGSHGHAKCEVVAKTDHEVAVTVKQVLQRDEVL